MPDFRKIELTAHVVTRMRQLYDSAPGHTEICGVLGGSISDQETASASEIIPLTNISSAGRSFAVDVDEFIQARNGILENGLVPLLFYHSHPRGSVEPSGRDLKLPSLISLPCLIFTSKQNSLLYKCFGMTRSQVHYMDVFEV